MMKTILSFVFIMITVAPATSHAKEAVVLLHGIGHTKWNMFLIENALSKADYEVINLTYPSTKKDIPTCAAFVKTKLDNLSIWNKYKKIHFVTHSMGGLVTRTYLHNYQEFIPPDKMGRVVMIAPPHKGSEVADLLENIFLYKWMFGPAGQQLTTRHQSKYDDKINYELGIIAGKKEWPYFVARHVIGDENDGRVAVRNTHLEGMKDHIVVPATHSFISWKPATHSLIINFLESGFFENKQK